MNKFSRNERVVAITKVLSENPNKLVSLNSFSAKLNAAKSTISEDIVIVRDTLEKLSYGKVKTIAGASGGMKYITNISEQEKDEFAIELCKELEKKDRIVAGSFIYMTDIMYNPTIIGKAGLILSTFFQDKDIDYVVTVETKGIPLAYEVAKNLGVQLVIARRDTKVTEGPTVTINYLSGSTGNIQNMSLSKKSLKDGSRCIYIDDFMKSGGTALGIKELLKEFDSEFVGMAVLVDNTETKKKLVDNYYSVVDFEGLDDECSAILRPSKMR